MNKRLILDDLRLRTDALRPGRKVMGHGGSGSVGGGRLLRHREDKVGSHCGKVEIVRIAEI